MKVLEVCSCGARIKVEGDEAIKLVREWRRNHPCRTPREDDEVSMIISDTSQTERSIGFSLQGLDVPARVTDPFEDE